MKPDLRVYGEIKGLSDAAWADPALTELREGLWLERLERRPESGVVEIEHEGHNLADADDLGSFLERAAMLLDEGGSGHAEHIDNDAWTLTRFVLAPGRLERKTVPIDAVLEGLELTQ